MVYLIQEISVFKTQCSCDKLESNKFIEIFTKSFLIINIKGLVNNYKKYIKENYNKSNDMFYIFKIYKSYNNAKKKTTLLLKTLIIKLVI